MTSKPIPQKTLPEQVKQPQRKFSRYLDLFLAIGTIGLVLVVAQGLIEFPSDSNSQKSVAKSEVRVLSVVTIEAKPVSFYTVSRTYTGEIAAIRTSNLGFSRSGEIERVFVKEGEKISKRQALAKLDTRNLQTQRQQLVAQKARAEAQLVELQTGARQEDINGAKAAVTDIEQQLKLQVQQRKRREFLHREGAISKEELDEFAFGEEVLQARLRQAQSDLAKLENGTRWEHLAAQKAVVKELEAQIADLDVTIEKSTLKAPFNGIISRRQLDEGTVVSAGEEVIRLIENVAPEARIGIPNHAIDSLTIGSVQTLKLRSQTYKATVASILPEVDVNTRTQTVVFKLAPSAILPIVPGQTIRLELEEKIATVAYWLPTDALTQGIRGLWNCYVVIEDDDGIQQVQQKAVEIIHQQSDRLTLMSL